IRHTESIRLRPLPESPKCPANPGEPAQCSTMNDSAEHNGDEPVDPGFAPEDYTDGRKLGEWRARDDEEARTSIRWEATYLTLVLALVVAAMLSVWLRYPQRILGLSEQRTLVFTQHALAALSGIFGGVVFAMKWLYHSVAKQLWNIDRR